MESLGQILRQELDGPTVLEYIGKDKEKSVFVYPQQDDDQPICLQVTDFCQVWNTFLTLDSLQEHCSASGLVNMNPLHFVKLLVQTIRTGLYTTTIESDCISLHLEYRLGFGMVLQGLFSLTECVEPRLQLQRIVRCVLESERIRRERLEDVNKELQEEIKKLRGGHSSDMVKQEHVKEEGKNIEPKQEQEEKHDTQQVQTEPCNNSNVRKAALRDLVNPSKRRKEQKRKGISFG